MPRSAAHASKRAESRPAGRVPNSRTTDTPSGATKRRLRANSLFGIVPRFRRLIWTHYKKHGRYDLPWRKNHDPYHILVSEIMLQQTQVERAIPFYKAFLKKFPNVRALAHASLSDILKSWQGLGYNRRAKLLRQAARIITEEYKGVFPRTVEELRHLPGVGPYTARAVAAFAYDQDVILIETNIRTSVIHQFFPNKKKVSDKEIEKILIQMLPKGKAREWYSALMDYGAHLKRSGISHNARSKTYTKKSKFSGSLREARGAILRELAKDPRTETRLASVLGNNRVLQMRHALKDLLTEGLIQRRGKVFTLPR